MKTVSSYWRTFDNSDNGHTLINVQFAAEYFDSKIGDTLEYLPERQTFRAALNDAKRYYKKTGRDCEIYARWTEQQISDVTGKIIFEDKDNCAHLGGTINGDWFDMCEDVPFEY